VPRLNPDTDAVPALAIGKAMGFDQ